MQSIDFDDYELSSESAFNYVTHKMIEMVEQESKTVKDLSSYRWVIGARVAKSIFPERPTRIFDYDVVYGDPVKFYSNGINFEPGVVIDTKNSEVTIKPTINYNEMYVKKEDKNMLDLKIYMSGMFYGGVVTKPQDLIKNVIFSGHCTIVQWSDGDKTIVRCENEDFDKEKGLAMAIVKKFFGTNESKSNYNDIFKKWIPDEDEVSKTKEPVKETAYMSVKQYANMTGMSKSTIIRQINSGKIFGAKKDETGKWVIPVGEV